MGRCVGSGAPRPPALRSAISYIDDNAADDIGVADIAAAVELTPRAVQYMFRKHLGTTPLGYLRRVRLERAHRDLVDADPTVDTVTAIAGRWGFAHAGRFSGTYRQTYGTAPSSTLYA